MKVFRSLFPHRLQDLNAANWCDSSRWNFFGHKTAANCWWQCSCDDARMWVSKSKLTAFLCVICMLTDCIYWLFWKGTRSNREVPSSLNCKQQKRISCVFFEMRDICWLFLASRQVKVRQNVKLFFNANWWVFVNKSWVCFCSSMLLHIRSCLAEFLNGTGTCWIAE